jgi:hypothetical protein
MIAAITMSILALCSVASMVSASAPTPRRSRRGAHMAGRRAARKGTEFIGLREDE